MACHRGHPRCDNRNNGNARTTSGATAKARVEADGLSAFCRFKSCPGAPAPAFLSASLICAGPAGGNPVCGALSFPAPALIDTNQPIRLGQHAPADAPVCAPGGYYGLSQQNLRRPRSAAGTAGRAGGWDGAEPGRRDGFSGGRLRPTTKFRPGTFIPPRRGGGQMAGIVIILRLEHRDNRTGMAYNAGAGRRRPGTAAQGKGRRNGDDRL